MPPYPSQSNLKRPVNPEIRETSRQGRKIGQWLVENRTDAMRLINTYGVPAAGITLSGPLLTVFPLGSLGPLIAMLTAALARFRLRQVTVGNFYALLHAGGFNGVWGQVVALMGFMGLGVSLGPIGTTLQSRLTTIALRPGGFQAPLLGLGLSVLANLVGTLGVIPASLASGSAAGLRMSSMQALYMELQSIVTFRTLGWVVDKLHLKWHSLEISKRRNIIKGYYEIVTQKGLSYGRRLTSSIYARWKNIVAIILRLQGPLIHLRKYQEAVQETQYGIEEDLEQWEMVDLCEGMDNESRKTQTGSPSKAAVHPSQEIRNQRRKIGVGHRGKSHRSGKFGIHNGPSVSYTIPDEWVLVEGRGDQCPGAFPAKFDDEQIFLDEYQRLAAWTAE